MIIESRISRVSIFEVEEVVEFRWHFFLLWSLFNGFALFLSAPPLKLIDLPGLEQRIVDESMVSCSKFRLYFGLLICRNMHIAYYP